MQTISVVGLFFRLRVLVRPREKADIDEIRKQFIQRLQDCDSAVVRYKNRLLEQRDEIALCLNGLSKYEA